jgi:hypothetical protein
VVADTTSVKDGEDAGDTTNLTISIPGTAGPFATSTNGLTWSYDQLNILGEAHTGTTADGYPVNANTLSY